MLPPDGPEEREAELEIDYERDIDAADIESMLGDEARDDLELQAERVMAHFMDRVIL